jgi:hypothetical protein
METQQNKECIVSGIIAAEGSIMLLPSKNS